MSTRPVPRDVLDELVYHYERGREVLDAAAAAVAARYAASLTVFGGVSPPDAAAARRLRNKEVRRVADRDLLSPGEVRAEAAFAELVDDPVGQFCSAVRRFVRAGRLGLTPEAAGWLADARDRDLIDLPDLLRSAYGPDHC